MKKKLSPIAIAGSLVLVSLLVWGVVYTVTAPKTADVIVVDYSGSTSDVRQQELGLVVGGLEADPPNTTVTVFRMGAATEEVFSGSLDDTSVESVTKAVKDGITKSDPHRGTNFANMAESVARYMDNVKFDRIRIRILTDGADDFKADRDVMARYRYAAENICEDARIESITFIGVKPGFRESVRSVWAKAGAKLKIEVGSQATDN